MMNRILLIGDMCTDIYQYGTVERISPEAPVPVFKFDHEESKPGMSGNVKLNLEAFGFEVVSLYGEMSTKTRLIDLKSRQHIVRIDNDIICKKPMPYSIVSQDLEKFDAIVISDYCKGLISYELVETLRAHWNGPIFIDTKKHELAKFEGCIVKINSTEFSAAKTLPSNLIVTLGSEGAMHINLGNEVRYPGHSVEVVDVCGAGDTFLAALVYKFLHTSDISTSIKFANKASSIAVQHSGVYVLNFGDIKSIEN